MITSLPDDIIVDILARVPRCNYPAVSLVSKHLRSLVVSHEIYARRSLLGCTETCLYGYLYNMETSACGLYILRRKSDSSNRLVLIPSLAELPCVCVRCAVAVGSRIYMFGNDMGFAIDCRSHTVQLLPKMPTPMEGIAADVIDKKVYVIGHTSSEEPKHIMAVFDTETQTWEPEVIEIDMYSGFYLYGHSVAIAGKMYMRNYKDSFVYGPKENKWETDEMLHSKNWNDPCVVGDTMYYYDTEKELRAYDTKNKYWRVVKGVLGQSFPEGTTPYCSSTVSYGGKIGVFTPILIESTKTRDILFMEISIERCQGGETWGNVECRDLVCEGSMFLNKPLAVTV